MTINTCIIIVWTKCDKMNTSNLRPTSIGLPNSVHKQSSLVRNPDELINRALHYDNARRNNSLHGSTINEKSGFEVSGTNSTSTNNYSSNRSSFGISNDGKHIVDTSYGLGDSRKNLRRMLLRRYLSTCYNVHVPVALL